jgi:hypothetical protein
VPLLGRRNKSPNTPPSESDEKELHRWAYSLVEDGREVNKPWIGQCWENLATYMGEFFAEWDPHKNRLVTPKKAKHRVRLPVNLAQPAVRTELAKLIKNRPITDILADSDSPDDIEAAEVADKVLNNWCEQEYRLGRKRRRMLNWVLACGSGGMFYDYDQTANPMDVLISPEGDPVHDARLIEQVQQEWRDRRKAPKYESIPEGDNRIRALGPFNLLYDLSEEEFDDAWWCVVSEIYDVIEVERRWGKTVEVNDRLKPGVIENRLLSKFDSTGKLSLKPPKAQDLCEIHRLFVKPGHPYFPQGLHLIFDKNEVIDKEGFPFKHGELPVSWMGHVQMPGVQHNLSILQSVKPVVLELSRTESQLVENRNLMSNPPWLVPEQHNVEAGSIQNRPGLRIRYRHAPNVPEPHPVQMPDMPQYVKDMPEMLKEHVLEISGQGETSQGQVPAGARSGVAIAYLQEADDTRLGPTVTEFEEAIERGSWMLLSNIAQFFDTPRTVRINKPHSAPEVLKFQGSMFTGIGGVQVQAGSALPRSKAAKQQFILDLWDRQIESDPRRLREMLEIGQGDADEWEIDMDQADREHNLLDLGEQAPVEDWFNHQAHLFRHHRRMKSAEYEDSPDEVKHAYEEHCADHERAMQDQARKQAIQQQQTGVDPNAQQDPNAQTGTPGANGGGPAQPAAASPYQGGGSPRDLMGDQPQ